MIGRNTYDVIIIGAGSIGTPAAMVMAAAGLKVLVVEKLASAGQGCNKAAIGGVRATHSDQAKIRLGLQSLKIFSTWQAEHGQDIGWHAGGYCFVAYNGQDEKSLKELLAVQQSYGLNIDWLDAHALYDLIPDINCEGLRGGTFSPDDGACSSLLANHAFFLSARESNADFHFHETLNRITIQNGRVSGIVTDRDSYQAAVVVNAAGPWAAQVGTLAGLSHPVQPDAHEAGISEPVAAFIEPMIVDIRPAEGSSGIYFYQHSTGQIIFCLTPDPQIWGFDCAETSEFLPLVSRRMINLVPKLANIRVRRTWRGLYPMTPDGSPIIGRTDQLEGYLMAIGMCGQGFMFGPAVGSLLTRIILQEHLPEADLEILRLLHPDRAFSSSEMLK